MALTEDQRAMLQLLLEGGQSYADIGSLLGVDAAEVRTRARRALTEIAGADPDAQVGLTDYLLGQADPIGRADAARHLQRDPEASALAARLSAQLRLLAPGARLPDLPAASATAATAPPAASATPPPATAPASAGRPLSSKPSVGAPGGPSAPGGVSQPGAGARVAGGARSVLDSLRSGASALGAKERRLPVALGAAALLILAVVLIATGVIGGDDGGGGGEPSTNQASGGAAQDVTVVPLEPAEPDSGASGQAAFVTAADQPLVQLNLSGLEPSSKDDTYIVWFYNSPEEAVPFAFKAADKNGNITGGAPLPAGIVSALPQVREIRVTLTTSSDAQKLVAATKNPGKPPPYVGQTVLQGSIPRSDEAIAPTTPTTPAP